MFSDDEFDEEAYEKELQAVPMAKLLADGFNTVGWAPMYDDGILKFKPL
jgi:hypothetical protein